MNFYPVELATPPLALVALLGCPEVHASVGEFLRSHHKPPINSLGVADPLTAPRLFGKPSV
jgi:trafficking protein particle complex subunit 11